MTHPHTIIALIAATALTVAPLAACGGSDNDDTQSTSPTGSTTSTVTPSVTVAATLPQWGSVAEKIGGDHVTVTSIIAGSNASTHDYEPTAADIATLTDADIAIVNGAGYDAWALDALASDTDTTVINVADINGITDGDNPHLWFSIDAVAKASDAIHQALLDTDAADSDDYDTAYETWTKAQDTVKENIDTIGTSIAGNTYVATEAVAQYLLDDLGLVDKTPQGYKNAVANDSEPSAQDLTEVTTMISNRAIGILTVNDQEQSDAATAMSDAASAANVNIFHVTESLPERMTNVLDWINYLADSLILMVPTINSAATGSTPSESAS